MLSNQLSNQKIYKGLDGIYVDTTSISRVDGEAGELSYRGHNIRSLVSRKFEAVVFLVLVGRFPDEKEILDLKQLLEDCGGIDEKQISLLKSINPNTHVMKVLQGMIPLIDLDESYRYPALNSAISEEGIKGLMIAAKLPSIIASYHRIATGRELVASKSGLSYHENFLYQFTGKLPNPVVVSTLDTTQILQMEHGFNASTFAARVTASTLAPIECCISSAIGTLFGKLHGGADQAALEMMLDIGSPDNAEKTVLSLLASKQKIMGMGHRVYRVLDPRAIILKPLAKKLCEDTPFENLYQTFEEVEEVMGREMEKRGKRIKANVEYYKAPVFYALGIPPEYFTSLFAMSRVFGYVAHVLESRKENKLIRPKALYVES